MGEHEAGRERSKGLVEIVWARAPGGNLTMAGSFHVGGGEERLGGRVNLEGDKGSGATINQAKK